MDELVAQRPASLDRSPDEPLALTEPTGKSGTPLAIWARPGEPPERVRSELLWRLAARLYLDHEPDSDRRCGAGVCGTCRQPWPCSGRRLAELGLNRAAA
jgi:hypothetical protein